MDAEQSTLAIEDRGEYYQAGEPTCTVVCLRLDRRVTRRSEKNAPMAGVA